MIHLVVGLLLLVGFALTVVLDGWSQASTETVFLRGGWTLISIANFVGAALQLHLHRAEQRALDHSEGAGEVGQAAH